MKNIRILCFVVLLGSLVNFDLYEEKEAIIICQMQNCEPVDSLYLWQFNGVTFEKLYAAGKNEEHNFQFNIPFTGHRFFNIGTTETNVRPVILGGEEKIIIKSDCRRFRSAQIAESPINKAYDYLKADMGKHSQQSNKLMMEYRRYARDSAKVASLMEQMQALDNEKSHLLDSLQESNAYLGTILSLNTYLSFQNNGGSYNNEIDYFANEYFKFVDWTKEELNYLPWVYEAAKGYTQTLSSVGLKQESHKAILELLLTKVSDDTRAYKLLFGGIIASLQKKEHPNFPYFANLFIEKYEQSDPIAISQIKTSLDRMKAFAVGGVAPDFVQQTPDGEDLSLSSLRGKVVLVDFWASWCGPCRRENPNVVRMYEKYKDKGFDILGVSLDSSKDKWLKAIDADGLEWHHVSDLKGWQNEVAGVYGVRSIPHTILLDEEGKIIARNLRGNALENKLAELMAGK